VRFMIKKTICIVLFSVLFVGCARCTVIRSEYCDISGKIFAPKPLQEDIYVFEGLSDRPSEEIGLVKVTARWDTPHKKLIAEMKKRAKGVGADAISDIKYDEDRGNRVLFCSRFGTTKKNITASAKALIFKDRN